MKKGFTLLELIIVIIVIGILASIALPKFLEVTERGRAAEGLNILTTVRGAQLRYFAQTSPSVYSAVNTDLDATFTTLKYFAWQAAAAADDNAQCVTATRNATQRPTGWGAYKLCVTPNGVVGCTQPGTECAKLGIAIAVCP